MLTLRRRAARAYRSIKSTPNMITSLQPTIPSGIVMTPVQPGSSAFMCYSLAIAFLSSYLLCLHLPSFVLTFLGTMTYDVIFSNMPTCNPINRVFIRQQRVHSDIINYLVYAAENLVSPANARADFFVLGLSVTILIEFGLSRQTHVRNLYLKDGRN